MKTAKELRAEGEKKYFNRVNECIEAMKTHIEDAGLTGRSRIQVNVGEFCRSYHIGIQDLSLFFVELNRLGYTVTENDKYETVIVSWS